MVVAEQNGSMLFDRQDLKRLILPLIGEQFLAMALGLVDTVMVASVGEAAISGISMVNIIATLIIQLLGALCTGGAVVVSQYVGRRDLDNACAAAEQLMLLAVSFMSLFTLVCLVFCRPILQLAFGAIELDVMESSFTYLFITAFSFPFLAAYNAAAAIFRSTGNSRAAMNTSVIMNVIHLILNAILIYGMHMGVAGAAISTAVSRIVAAVLVLLLLKNQNLLVYIEHYRRIRPSFDMLKNIFRIGVPNGIENGMFNFGKILVQGVIAGLGTAALAANAVLNSVSSVVIVPGQAMSYAMITVVGQCLGAGEIGQAQHYAKKLLKLTYLLMIAANLPLLLFGRPILGLFQLSGEATDIAMGIIPLLVLCHVTAWPPSFTLPSALRAAGDVRYTMVIAFVSMWTMRVGLSYVFVVFLGVGVASVWYSMFLDWVLRMVFFALRYRGGKWKTMKVLG